eukprot:gene9343-12626_t
MLRLIAVRGIYRKIPILSFQNFRFHSSQKIDIIQDKIALIFQPNLADDLRQKMYDDFIKSSSESIEKIRAFELRHITDLMQLGANFQLRSDYRFITAALILKKDAKMTAIDLRKAIYGLKGIEKTIDWKNHSAPATQDISHLLITLTPMVLHCEQELYASSIGAVLFGLKSLNSDHPEVVRLLSALLPRVEACDRNFTSKTLSMAFHGLQGMSSDHPEVLQL